MCFACKNKAQFRKAFFLIPRSSIYYTVYKVSTRKKGWDESRDSHRGETK